MSRLDFEGRKPRKDQWIVITERDNEYDRASGRVTTDHMCFDYESMKAEIDENLKVYAHLNPKIEVQEISVRTAIVRTGK